jgi:hypothetical protein
MDVGQRVAGCAVRVISRLGRFFEGTSENDVNAKFTEITHLPHSPDLEERISLEPAG